MTPEDSATAVKRADPIAAEIARWQAFLATSPAGDEEFKALRAGFGPLLDQAQQALREGHRLYALNRLAIVVPAFGGQEYAASKAARPAEMATLEREWKRLRQTLAPFLDATPAAAARSTPALARALTEAATNQVRAFHDASVDYGRATMAQYGLTYLGMAQAQAGFADFSRQALAATGMPLPPLRSLLPEIERLEDELALAYRPPASVEQHPLFIRSSALLKEARELDGKGQRYGALQRLLEARLRISRLPGKAAPMELAQIEPRVRASREQLAASGVDHTLAFLYLETALFEGLAKPAAPSGPETARAVLEDILPLYRAALGPAPPRPASKPAEVTVTFVRWPFT